MSNIKWSHDDINNKIMEVMNVSQPAATGGKPSLQGILNTVKGIPQNLLGLGKTPKTSPATPQQATVASQSPTGKNVQAG